MKISVAYADSEHQFWLPVEVEEGASAAEAIEQSGLLDLIELDIDRHKIGIFGKLIRPGSGLQEGDRVEIYQPITRVIDEDDDDDDD